MKEKTYSTTNIYLSAYLYAADESAFIGTTRDNNNFYSFNFKSEILSRSTDEIEKEYWNNGGSIVPKKYADALRSLKERVRK
jgi:hypothetical protein